MSSNKKKKRIKESTTKKDGTFDKKEPLAERKRPNIIYITIAATITITGIILFIIGMTTQNESLGSTLFIISLGLIGLGIMLIVQRSVYKQSKTTSKPEKKVENDESLQLRNRK